MSSLLTIVKSRLSNRPDSEHQQAIVRLVIVSLFLVYLFCLLSVADVHTEVVENAFTYVLVDGAVGAVLITWLLLRPGVSHVRRGIGMMSDYAAMGAVMSLSGQELAPLYVIFLWVTIGNGLRYGSRYLLAAVALAAASFLCVILTTPFWQQNQTLSWSLLGGLIAIPLYLTSLLRALTRATEEARRANEAKSRFLANMSHEFRTPLNAILGFTQLMQMDSTVPAGQQAKLQLMRDSGLHLLELINDVLDVASIEAGKVALKPSAVDIRALLDMARDSVRLRAEQKNLALRADIDPRLPHLVMVDGQRLRQVLLNLLSNAVKFTDTGSVELAAHVIEQQPAQVRVRFEVSDSGIGMTPAQQARLFQAFEQVSDASRQLGGTGLGLSISQQLVRLMGGLIAVRSAEGQGSSFGFELSLALA